MQILACYLRWLEANWRAASVVCLDLLGSSSLPASAHLDPPEPGPPAGRLRALRLRFNVVRNNVRRRRSAPGTPALVAWLAAVAAQCPNLRAFHVAGAYFQALPALPGLVHLALDISLITPALFPSLRNLPVLETLHLRGAWDGLDWALAQQGARRPAFDLTPCVRLRHASFGFVKVLDTAAMMAWDPALPPGCMVTLEFMHPDLEPEPLWLARYGPRLQAVRIHLERNAPLSGCRSVPFAAQLAHVRRLDLIFDGPLYQRPGSGSCFVLADVLACLPPRLESLRLEHPRVEVLRAGGPCNRIEVPAGLRALRLKSSLGWELEDAEGRSMTAWMPTFLLHASLSRLYLLLWSTCVALECLDAGAAAGLQALNVQARSVFPDAQLAAEVGARGREFVTRQSSMGKVFTPEDDGNWSYMHDGQEVHVVRIGRRPVPMEFEGGCQLVDWPCMCGACGECCPGVFERVR